MSCTQFHCIKMFILRHAWLNLWDKHMTTGRINQVTFVWERKKSSQFEMNQTGSILSSLTLVNTNRTDCSVSTRLTVVYGTYKRFCFYFKKKKTYCSLHWSVNLARYSNATHSRVSLCFSSVLSTMPSIEPYSHFTQHNQHEHRGSHRKRTNTPRVTKKDDRSNRRGELGCQEESNESTQFSARTR